jgi:hypothetical protein
MRESTMFEPTTCSEPVPPVDLERYQDAEWALHDPQIQQHYQGQWVVAYERHILAHGPDAQAVIEQAACLVPGQAHRLVLCLPDDSAEWLQHTPDPTVAFPDA